MTNKHDKKTKEFVKKLEAEETRVANQVRKKRKVDKAKVKKFLQNRR